MRDPRRAVVIGAILVATNFASAAPTVTGFSVRVADGVPTKLSLAYSGVDASASIGFEIVEGPSHGHLSEISPAGSLSYTAEPGFVGIDQLRYRVSDGSSRSDVATVEILVQHFPDSEWEERDPESLGLLREPLTRFVERVGGAGMIVKDGYVAQRWGDQSEPSDWASAGKPLLSTLLFFALEDGLIESVHEPVTNATESANLGPLRPEDSEMTFWHLANNVSGYARAEAPGEAWSYNDIGINLYGRLIEGLFGNSLQEVAVDKLAPLELQDGPTFNPVRATRPVLSNRDYARIGWFWLNRGNWRGEQLISEATFEEFARPQVPREIPRTEAANDDYLGVGSYGGGSNGTEHGPGLYGFNWWFNGEAPGTARRAWPDAPIDTMQANGHYGLAMIVVLPSLNMVIAHRGSWGTFEPGNAASGINRNLALLVAASSPDSAVPDGGDRTIDLAAGETTSAHVHADAFTKSTIADLNRGNREVVWVNTFASQRAFLAFDLDSLANAPVSEALMTLRVEAAHRAGEIAVHRVLEEWDEYRLTHNNQPAFEPEPVAHFSVEERYAGETVQVDVSSLVRDWLAEPQENYGLVLVSASGTALIGTKEGGTHAQLEITVGAPETTNRARSNEPLSNSELDGRTAPESGRSRAGTPVSVPAIAGAHLARPIEGGDTVWDIPAGFGAEVALFVERLDSRSAEIATVDSALPGQLIVDPANPSWLAYNGEGPAFIAGAGDPEDFLYRGTRNPDGTRRGDQLEIIDRLATSGANGLYVIAVRSHGGDGNRTHNPFIGNDHEMGLDPAVLDQWDEWFTRLDANGTNIVFFIYDDDVTVWDTGDVVSSAEASFISGLVNRFEHLRHLIWVVAEEYAESLSVARVSALAEQIRAADDFDHPIAVHKNVSLEFDEFADDPNIDQFAIQFDSESAAEIHEGVLSAWADAAGRYNLNFAENARHGSGATARGINWAAAMSGAHVMVIGMNVVDTPAADLRDLGVLRRSMEAMPLNRMRPSDDLALSGSQWVLADPGSAYLVYADAAGARSLGLRDLPRGTYRLRWLDIEEGELVVSPVEQALADASLVLGSVTGVSSDQIPLGVVIDQMPSAGTAVLPGTKVDVTVSVGQAD